MEQTLEEMEQQLKGIVSDFYAPETTRWNRKYSDCADWYFISKNEGWK